MVGILFSLIAGVLVSTQNAFNARVGAKVGSIETTVVVHAVGLAAAILLTLFMGDGNIRRIGEVNKVYLLGGVFGVGIVFSAMKGFNMLGASYAAILMVISQLVVATLIDKYGLFGAAKIELDFTKYLGLAVIIAGIIIFNSKGNVA